MTIMIIVFRFSVLFSSCGLKHRVWLSRRIELPSGQRLSLPPDRKEKKQGISRQQQIWIFCYSDCIRGMTWRTFFSSFLTSSFFETPGMICRLKHKASRSDDIFLVVSSRDPCLPLSIELMTAWYPLCVSSVSHAIPDVILPETSLTAWSRDDFLS